MDKKEIFNRIEYVVACVGAFAQRFNLSNMQLRISEIKADPINNVLSSNITKTDDSLGDMLVKIIKEVEYTKIIIAEFIW